jgi:hypothetical protein
MVWKAAGSIPAASTFLQKKPFGENVEGLSYCGAKSCVICVRLCCSSIVFVTYASLFRKPFAGEELQ